jgi:hypothetical protein
MKFYELNSVFTFGKYQGKTALEILNLQPSYLDWCAINLDHFIMSENVIDEIEKLEPTFAFSPEGLQKMDEKLDQWNDEITSYQDYDEDYDDRNADYNQTDWSNYNDDLDMDQQSIEFWNQF